MVLKRSMLRSPKPSRLSCVSWRRSTICWCARGPISMPSAARAPPAWASRCPAPTGCGFRAAVFLRPDCSQAEADAPQRLPARCPTPRAAAGCQAGLPANRIISGRVPSSLRIFLPTLIAIALLLAAIWGITLPSFERTLLERKREMIRELTNSAWSILASYRPRRTGRPAHPRTGPGAGDDAHRGAALRPGRQRLLLDSRPTAAP